MKNRISFMLFIFLMSLLFLVSCSDDPSGCRKPSDCPFGQICVDKECVDDPSDDSDSATDSASDGDSDTDSDTDTDTDSDTDTEEPECDPFAFEGDSCEFSCECYTGHCNNGLCCESGECCNLSSNCRHDECATPLCSSWMCDYVSIGYDCGSQDNAGYETCTGDSVCDGNMNCAEVSVSCGFYNATSAVDCSGAAPVRACYSSCNAGNVAINCTADAKCVAGKCIDSNLKEDGQTCGGNAECISGHCDNSVCCASGDCCADVSDCSDLCRLDVICSTGFQCLSTFMNCGAPDSTGQTCLGNNRCDGQGGCVDLATCFEQESVYQWNGTYTCGVGSVSESCHASCTGNGQCMPGYQCNLATNQCIGPNGATCFGNDDCASGHCVNNVCCSGNTCCNDDSDCQSGCRPGGTCNMGLYQCEGGTNLLCGDQNTGCEGDNRCDGFGNCALEFNDCVVDATSFTCARNSVERNCACIDNPDCDNDSLFCNGSYPCDDGICRFTSVVPACSASPCSEETCHEALDICEPLPDPCEGSAAPCDPKKCVEDVLGTGFTCEPHPDPDGTFCDDGDICNGAGDRCEAGLCVPGPSSTAYCFDGNPCTVDLCTDNGDGTADCDNDAVNPGDACTSEFNCFGTAGVCEWNRTGTDLVCIASEDVCDTNGDGVCWQHTCTEDFMADDVTCSTVLSPFKVMGCGDVVVLSESDFATRANYFYSGSCAAGGLDFVGKEAVVILRPDEENDIVGAALIIDSVSPASQGDLEFLWMGADRCDIDNCSAHQTNGFAGISIAADSTFSPAVIIDSIDDVWPPTSLTLRFHCP